MTTSNMQRLVFDPLLTTATDSVALMTLSTKGNGESMKRLLLTLCISASTVSEAQSTQQSKKPLFASCWQQGVIISQNSCIAHIYLNQVEAILEVLRAPDAKPRATAEATFQAMLSDQLYRQKQKARLYHETCNDIQRATRGGDSVSSRSSEPPRDYRRLHFVRTWSHGEIPNTSI